MKCIVKIMGCFFQAADASRTLFAFAFAFVFTLPPPPNYLIINNLREFYYDGEFPDKTHRRQSWRLANELRRLGKNKFIRTLFPQCGSACRLREHDTPNKAAGNTKNRPRIARHNEEGSA